MRLGSFLQRQSDVICSPVPREKLVEALGGMILQARQDVGEPGLRIDIVELGRLDQPSFSALLARSRSRLIASASRIGAAASSVLHY